MSQLTFALSDLLDLWSLVFSFSVHLGKADLTRYREAGAEVISVLSQFERCRVERASVDEAYIDLTDAIQDMISQEIVVTGDDLRNTYIVGTDDGESVDRLVVRE